MSLHSSLRIGDTVLFYVRQGGYVYSELSSSPYSIMTLLPVPTKPGAEKKLNFPNIKYAAFKVIAPNKYKAQQRFYNLKKSKRDQEGRDYHYDYYEYCAREEVEENEQEQARKNGTKVSFGDLIQLQHIGSKRYVTVCSEPSLTESENLMINLREWNSVGAIFKVHSKYTVRSVGDVVRFSDQLKLESVKKHGQYLHASSARFTLGAAGYNVLSDCLELNASPTESALTLILHYSPFKKHHEKALLAGSCVRLFHQENECYIVAEGSFAELNPVEDVHCRLRRVNSRKHAIPSSSANTYWQIEKDTDPRSGGVVYWGDSCRIKHLPTRRYLCVTKDFKVKLKKRSFKDSDYDTLFSFQSLNEEEDEVLIDSYANIKHIRTGRWLHLDKTESYKRKDFKPEKGGLHAVQWDFAKLYELRTTNGREGVSDFESFTLQLVNEDLLDKFNYVAGVVPVLSAYIEEGGVYQQKELDRVKNVLVELQSWLFVIDDERETKNRQKLLRNLRVLKQLKKILKSGNDGSEIKTSQIEIYQACYEVFKTYLKGDSRKNENYLARFIPFFQTQIHKGLKAEEVLVEIVQDNFDIISKMAESRTDDMIKQFCTTKDTRYLEFLSSLCVCNGRPIPSIQDRLLKDFVLVRGQEFFLRTKVVKNDDGREEVFYHQIESPEDLESIRKLKPSAPKKAKLKRNPEKGDYDFLVAQLHLFAKLCKGNNQSSIKELVYDSTDNPTGYIDFQQAIVCAKDNNVDPKLRARYVELILVMFVDVGKNRPFMDHLCYSFIYNDLAAQPYSGTKEDAVALTKEKNIHFGDLRMWIRGALDVDEIDCYDCGVLKKTLDIMAHLIRFGYYDNEEHVNDVVEPLNELLGKNSNSYEERESDRHHFLAVKGKALEVIELLFRFRFYVILQKFMNDFKDLYDDNAVSVTVANLGKLLTNSKVDNDTDTRVAVTTHLGNHLQTFKGLEIVLLKLCTDTNTKILTASLNLLTQMYYLPYDLYTKAQQSQLLTSEQSIKDYNEVNEHILPELRLLLKADTNQKKQEKIIKLLRSLSSLCVLSLSSGIREPNTQNQIMLDNFGLVSEILSYVLKMTSESEGRQHSLGESDISVQETLFRECFCILRLLATDRKSVQKQLFNRIDDLLNMKLSDVAMADIADLLTEVFTGGVELVLKDSKSHIQRIFEIIVSCHNATVQVQFMATLQAMAKIEELDLPVSNNQDLIVKNFCHFQDSFCHDIVGKGQDLQPKRMKILRAPERNPIDPQLQRLLGITDLLATCAESDNLFIQSVCEKTFSLEEIFDIISTDLLPICKKPFVRFLIQVYMKTKSEERQGSQIRIELTHGTLMWKYLEHVAMLLENAAKAVSLVPSEEKGIIERQISTLTKRRSSLGPYSPVSDLPHTFSIVLPDVTDDHGRLIPGLLEYVAEGIVPLLHTFYCTLFKPDNDNEDQKEREYFVSERELLISADITKGLMQLSDELIKCLSREIHIALFQDTLDILMNNTEIDTRLGIDQEKKSIIKQHSLEVSQLTSQRRRSTLQGGVVDTVTVQEVVPDDVLQQYEYQTQLNDSFNSFSYKYQEVYHGQNKAINQIGSSVENLDYSDKGEELPLGESFQELVILFWNIDLYYDVPESENTHAEYTVVALLDQLEFSNSRTEQLNETDQIKQDILDVRCLQILRALIHNRIKLIDPDLKESNPIKFRDKCNSLVVPVQDKIQKLAKKNSIRRIIPLLSHPNESVSREALALMKALLFSGNMEVQKGLAEDVKSTKEETMFISLKKRLDIASIHYTEIRELEKQLAAREKKTREMTKRSSSVGGNISPVLQGSPETDQKEVAIEMSILEKEDEPSYSDDSQPIVTSTDSQKQASIESEKDSIESQHSSSKEEATPFNKVLDVADETSWTGLILEVVGLMCDGQYKTLQDYLRDQHDNFVHVNMVAEIGDLLNTYTIDMSHSEDLKQVHQILQVLIEMCVGNFENQHVIFKQVVEPINRILQLPYEFYHDEYYQYYDNDEHKLTECTKCKDRRLDLIQVIGSAVEFLNVLLEETSPESSVIAKEIGSLLDDYYVMRIIEKFHAWKSLPFVKDGKKDDDCERGMFRSYQIIASLIGYGASEIKKDELQNYLNKDILNKCENNERSIEIHYVYEDEPLAEKSWLTKVHFPFDSDDRLRKEITEQVRWNINRESMEAKQIALVEIMPALKRDIKHRMNLKDMKYLYLFLAYYKPRFNLLMFLTVLLNMFILFVYEVPSTATDNNKTFRPDNPFWFEPVILYTLGPIHLIMSIWIVTEYFIINWPHFKFPQKFYIAWFVTKYFHNNQSDFKFPWPWPFNTFWTRIKSFKGEVDKNFKSAYEHLPKFTFIDVPIFGVTTMYMIVFLLCSILSLAFSGYFYPLCLPLIIYNNDILARVLRAVTKNGYSLIWVAILGLVVLFIYAVISFGLLHNQFIITDDANLYCDTLTQCMYSVMRYGLIDNIGLLVPFSNDGYSSNRQPVRLIYDLSFFIIVTTIGLNIVFGIIIDTFGELREERVMIETEQRTKCFICDLPTHEFERRAEGGFKKHITDDHNMWNYVYYSVYLDSIDTGDHNAIQKYVYDLIKKEETGFFPQEEAQSLSGKDDLTIKHLQDLHDKIETVLQQSKEKEHAKNKSAKKAEQQKLIDDVMKLQDPLEDSSS